MNNIFRALSGLLIALLFQSCQSYQALDLDPEQILKEVEESRKTPPQSSMDFTQAAKLMSEKNHSLKLLQLEYQKHQKIADLKTPLPNPVLEFGPAFGSRLEDTTASSTQPFIGIGFSIPLGPRLARQDDVNKSRAMQAYNNTVLEHRKLYFELRKAYIDLMLTQEKVEVLNKVETTLELTKKITAKLVDVGTSTKIDVSQVNIELAQIKIQKLEIETELNLARGKLAELTGISIHSLTNTRVKKLALKNVDVKEEELKRVLMDNNHNLARQEMQFHLADIQLKLELSKQYPDLNIGASYEQDVGEKKRVLSLPFSIALPVFDRNQQSIAGSFSERNLQLERYKKVLFIELNKLEISNFHFKKSQEKLNLLEKEVLPLSKENLKDAQKALRFGSIGVLRYLDLLKSSEAIEFDAVEQKRHIWRELLKIEKTIGLPLVNLSDEGLKNLKTQTKKMVK